MPAVGKILTARLLEVKVEPLGEKLLGYRKNPQLWVTFLPVTGSKIWNIAPSKDKSSKKKTEKRN